MPLKSHQASIYDCVVNARGMEKEGREQSLHAFGRFIVQGKNGDAARLLINSSIYILIRYDKK